MSKGELDKNEIDRLTQEYFDMLSKNTDLSTIQKQIEFMTKTIPNYIQSLYSMGFKNGYLKGKQEKLDHIVKNN